MTIIAFAGLKNSGKSTCASFAEKMLIGKHPYFRTSFAAAIRDTAAKAFNIELETFYNTLTKESSLPQLNGRSPRQVLQAIGETLREYDPDIWLNIVMNNVYKHDIGDICLIDDLRFRNEACAVHEEHGIIVYIERGLVSSEHASEQAHLLKPICDIVIHNNAGFQELYNAVSDFIQHVIG